jgi:hypothetical protein
MCDVKTKGFLQQYVLPYAGKLRNLTLTWAGGSTTLPVWKVTILFLLNGKSVDAVVFQYPTVLKFTQPTLTKITGQKMTLQQVIAQECALSKAGKINGFGLQVEFCGMGLGKCPYPPKSTQVTISGLPAAIASGWYFSADTKVLSWSISQGQPVSGTPGPSVQQGIVIPPPGVTMGVERMPFGGMAAWDMGYSSELALLAKFMKAFDD